MTKRTHTTGLHGMLYFPLQIWTEHDGCVTLNRFCQSFGEKKRERERDRERERERESVCVCVFCGVIPGSVVRPRKREKKRLFFII